MGRRSIGRASLFTMSSTMACSRVRRYPAKRSMVSGSNRAVAYSMPPLMWSPVSCRASVRSNLAVVRVSMRSGVAVSPVSVSVSSGVFCHTNTTWNSGLRARLRVGRVSSTTCSNGMSSCCCAAMARAFTCRSSAPTLGASSRSMRSASMLAKKPISGSSSACPRLATAVPITTSRWRDSLDSSTAQPASSVMNRVVPCRWLKAFRPAVRVASSVTSSSAPAYARRSGRGWSVGSSSCSGASASIVFQ